MPVYHDTSTPTRFSFDIPAFQNTIDFFAVRARSLERLFVSNTQFGHAQTLPGLQDLGLGMTPALIEVFQSAPHLVEFSWKMVRQPHTEDCMQRTFAGCMSMRPLTTYNCGRYGPNIRCSHWDFLARELELELDGEAQTWDLAKAVLPERDI